MYYTYIIVILDHILVFNISSLLHIGDLQVVLDLPCRVVAGICYEFLSFVYLYAKSSMHQIKHSMGIITMIICSVLLNILINQYLHPINPTKDGCQ